MKQLCIAAISFAILYALAQDTLAQAQSAAPETTVQLETRATAPQGQSNKATITVPSETHVMRQLGSPLDTESAVKGSGVYLETFFPVICSNHVVIPAHTSVQGLVHAERRAGHFARSAALSMRFTALVFPNGYTVPIDGVLQSLPGSSGARVKGK